jgi:S1-C subfamily serine protease
MRITTPVLVAAALVAAGCGSSASDGARSTKAPAPVSAGRDAIVFVQGFYTATKTTPAKSTSATGVIFSARQGLVLTANHAVEQAPNIDVTLGDGSLVHARTVARAQCHDLAVLKLVSPPPGLAQLPLGDSGAVGVGEPVVTLTYGARAAEAERPRPTRVQGTVAAVDVLERFTPLPPTGPFIAHRTSLPAAASGSPLLDGNGKMIGLNTLVAHPRKPDVPGVEYALTSKYIRKRLGELRRGVGGALGGWEAEHNACHAALEKLVGIGHTHESGTPPATAGGSRETGAGGGTGTGGGGGSGGGTGTGAGPAVRTQTTP